MRHLLSRRNSCTIICTWVFFTFCRRLRCNTSLHIGCYAVHISHLRLMQWFFSWYWTQTFSYLHTLRRVASVKVAARCRFAGINDSLELNACWSQGLIQDGYDQFQHRIAMPRVSLHVGYFVISQYVHTHSHFSHAWSSGETEEDESQVPDLSSTWGTITTKPLESRITLLQCPPPPFTHTHTGLALALLRCMCVLGVYICERKISKNTKQIDFSFLLWENYPSERFWLNDKRILLWSGCQWLLLDTKRKSMWGVQRSSPLH